MFVVGFSDTLFQSLTPEIASGMHMRPPPCVNANYCNDFSGCDQQYFIGRFGYIIGNTPFNDYNETDDIHVNEFQVLSTECKKHMHLQRPSYQGFTNA